MDAATATVIAAVIGAVVAIVVALIQRNRPPRPNGTTGSPEVRQHHGANSQDASSSDATMEKPVISEGSSGDQYVVASMLYLPHRRKLVVHRDVVAKAAIKQKVEESESWARIARGRTSLYDFLDWYYRPQGYALLQRSNPITKATMRYPVTVIPVPSQQQSDAESVLGELDPTKIEEKVGQKSPFVVADDWAWYERIALRPDDYHDDVVKYTMRRIDRDPVRISGALGWYFDALRTCDSLEREILDFFGQHDPECREYDGVLEQLVQRKRVHSEVRDPVVSGEGRSAAVAISVLVAYKHGDEYFALLEKRSSKTAVHSSLYHVVPSGMMGPECGSWQGEWSVWHQFQREYLEEVMGFGETEIPSPGMELPFDWFYKHPELLRLSQLIRGKEASFYLTGIAINLLNLRPEICGLLRIDTQEWVMSTRIAYNWEFVGADSTDARQPKRIMTVPVGNDLAIFGKVNFVPESVVPPGSAAFWLGVDKVRELTRVRGRHTSE